jgi:formate dehydrogenase iron-sulfur subunit
MEPACAQACPTDSIRFGEVTDLMQLADARAAELKAQGVNGYVYGKEDIVGGLNAFYVLVDEPHVYGLPDRPELPSKNVGTGFALSAATAAALAVGSVVSFRKDRMDGMADDTREPRRLAGPEGDGTTAP